MENYADLMFHEAVADLQKTDGSYDKFQVGYKHRTQDSLSADDIAFIQSRESAYIATTTPDGWPYVQHRGGARGFFKVVNANQLVCGDYRGNRQFISMGNLETNTRISMFFMDYMNKARLKIQGHATLQSAADASPEILALVQDEGPAAERVLTVDVVAMDWNCPKYIPDFYPADMVRHVVAREMDKLRQENAALREALQNQTK
ncbi:pyridoxamine 5'-phosphate oxidase family protein [uncultured Shimia sp.]|uniref:pyridoxamine 5'-phosphate oxidase family protein n=1 Tax=uncultured Shimia sp. TaxID=573152 RepID=UPI0026333082|nr:pyridoxamine 5'-phosphate oxidase family protein [uncultured Shimia sp.]